MARPCNEKKQTKEKNPPPNSPASDNISVELLPPSVSKAKNKQLSSQSIARQYNLLLDDNLRLREMNKSLETKCGDIRRLEHIEHKYDQACTEVRYLRYQLDIINIASKQPTYGQIDALDLTNYEGWIGPRPQD